MAEAIILPTGIVKRSENLSGISYQHRSGYVVGFIFQGINYIHCLKGDFLKNDQGSSDITAGFYRKTEFLKYLVKEISSDEMPGYKLDLSKLSNAILNDTVRVRKLYIQSPYNKLYQKIEYTWNYDPASNVFNGSDIAIPSDADEDIVDVIINGVAKGFYDHNIGLITSNDFLENKNEGAYYVTLIALQIKRINDDVFNLLETPGLSNYIASQNVEWQFGEIFNLPTIEDLVQYLESLTNFYNSVYSNQVLIVNASEKRKLYWVANVLSSSGLAVVSIADKLALLLQIINTESTVDRHSHDNLTALILHNGPEIILKIVESVSVAPNQADYFMDQLLEFNYFKADKNITLFEALYNFYVDNFVGVITSGLINIDDQRKELIHSIFNIWKISKYNPYYDSPNYTNPPKSNGVLEESFFMTIDGKKYYHPVKAPKILVYDSSGTDFTSYVVSFEYGLNGKNIDVTKVATTSTVLEHGGGTNVTRTPYGSYHLYQPLTVTGFKPEFTFDGLATNCTPVFVLYYLSDYKKIKDIELAAMLVFNIALNFTILGEISSISYLNEISALSDLSILPAESPILFWDTVLGINRVVRFTAGTASTIFDYIANNEDDPQLKSFCGTLSAFLGMLSFGADCFDNLAQAKLMTAANNVAVDRAHLMSLGADIDLSDDVVRELNTLLNVEELVNRMNIKLSQISFNSADTITEKFASLSHEEQIAFFSDFYFLSDNNKWDRLNDTYIFIINNPDGTTTSITRTLMDDWNEVKELKGFRREIDFLESFKFIKSDEKLLQHIFEGHAWATGSNGCHSVVAINTNNAIILSYINQANSDGYYKVMVSIKNNSGTYIVKNSPSTFFKDIWNQQRIIEEVSLAYSRKVFDIGSKNRWLGKMSDGNLCAIAINGNTAIIDNTTQIKTAFPYITF